MTETLTGVLRARLATSLVLVAVVAAACSSDGVVVAGTAPDQSPTVDPTAEPTAKPTTGPADPIDEAALAALDDARQRWAAAGLTEYSYTYTRSCECDLPERGPNTVRVAGGEVVEVTDEFGQPVEIPGDTIEELFDRTEESIRAGEQTANEYDPDLGHPTRVSLDVEAQAYDGGYALEIVDFAPTGELRAELEAARARWDAERPESYSMTYRLLCFCPELRATVSVEGDEVIAAESVGEFDVDVFTVDDLFEEIDQALDQGAASVSVTYDEQYGYPVEHFIDEEANMADEEHGVAVEAFEPG